MKTLYLLIPAFFLSLGLLAQTPAPEVQKADRLEVDTVGVEERYDAAEILNELEEGEDTLVSEVVKPQAEESFQPASKMDKAPNPTTVTFTASQTWAVPPGVYEIIVEAWGGGGGGGGSNSNGNGGSGGGGGGYVYDTLSVTPGQTIPVTVGQGGGAGASNGGNGGNGGNTTILTLVANGGTGGGGNAGTPGSGGTASGGSINQTGGNGEQGGSSGGDGGDGANGGAGGQGRSNNSGLPGSAPGGGGGGGERYSHWLWGNTNYPGGAGARGEVRITYTISEIFTTPGDGYIFTVPTGVTLISVEAWGGGGGGGTDTDAFGPGGGGGGGGAYSRRIMPVVPGEKYTATVGAGGSGGAGSAAQKTGGTSEFRGPNPASTVWVRAVGGVGVPNNDTDGALGGSDANGIGEVKNSGGNGADGGNFFIFGLVPFSGGGGGGAGLNGFGGNANDDTGGNGVPSGGNGAEGRVRFLGGEGSGRNGNSYGGGGSGAVSDLGGSDYNGGNGAPGAVIIKWEIVKCDVEVNELFSESTVTPSIDPVTGIYYFDLCQDDLLELKAKAICDFCSTANYRWIFPDTGFEANGESYLINNVSSAMEGTLVVEGNNGQCYDSKRFRIRPSPGPSIDLGRELALCAGVPAEISIGNPDTDPASEDDHITVEAFSASDPFFYSVPFDSSAIEWNGSSLSGFPGTLTVNPDPGASLNHTLGVLTVTDAFGCSSTFNYVKDVDGIPNDVRTAMSTGDFIWSGYSNSLWTTTGSNGNWLYKTASGFDYSSSVPGLNNDVFIADYCRINFMPHSSGNIVSRDMNILSDGQLDLGNHQTFFLYGDFTNQGIFSAGTGSTVIFSGNLAQEVRTGGTGTNHDFENVTLGKSNGNALVSLVDHDMRINGTLNLQTGIVETGALKVEVTNSSPAAVSDGNTDSYIFGNLRRYFASNSGSYAFPVGSSSNYRLAELENESLTGINYIDARFLSDFGNSNPELLSATDFGTPYVEVANAGIWQITPNGPPSSGSYDIKLYFDDEDDDFGLNDNKFGVIRRPSGSTSASAWIGEGLPGDGVISPENGEGRLVDHGFASRYGLTSFSEFGIGKSSDPLPIELLSFTATYRAPEVVLEWATGSEINNDFFTIERSLDVEHAEIIGYLDGAGNSSQTLWYSFVDQNPLPGISYYRLKQTDFDGKFEYFDWVAVDAGLADGDGLKVLVETLPLGYNLRIFSPGGRRLQVEVTDLLGRRVINEQLSAPEQGQVEVFIPATASRQSVLIYRVTDGIEVVAGKMVR